jgi:hypothetical protein
MAQTQPGFADISGSISPSRCPDASSGAAGCVEPDNATISVSGGIISPLAPLAVRANMALTGANCGKVHSLSTGTGAQITLTIPLPSGLPAGCRIEIVNNDTSVLVGHVISGAPLPGTGTSYILYPTQRIVIFNLSAAWIYSKQPGRWTVPTGGALLWYTNYNSGSDTAGVNDGLSPSRPFKTAENAIYTHLAQVECNGGQNEVQAIIMMAANQADQTGVHWAPHDLLGCPGGAAVEVVGASLAVTNATNNGSGLCRLTTAISANFTGSISGTTLTVYGVSAGAANNVDGQSAQITVGQAITGTGVTGGTTITALGTGSGGTGTYTVSTSQAVGALAMTGSVAGGGSAYASNQVVMVYGIAGATECNGLWRVTPVDSSHIDLQNSSFTSSFTGSGTVTEGSGFHNGFDIETYFGAVLQLWNMSFLDTVGNNTVQALQGATVYLQSGNFFFGAQSGSDIFAIQHGRVIIVAPYGVAGTQSGQVAHLVALQGGLVSNTSGFYMLPTQGFTYAIATAFAAQGGMLETAGPISAPGVTVNAKRCEADLLSYVDSQTGAPNSYWPGNSNCTTSLGGQVN